jgi:hypothetical protein
MPERGLLCHVALVLLLVASTGDPGQHEGDEDDRTDPLHGYAGESEHVLDEVEQEDAGERAEDGEDGAVALGGDHRRERTAATVSSLPRPTVNTRPKPSCSLLVRTMT